MNKLIRCNAAHAERNVLKQSSAASVAHKNEICSNGSKDFTECLEKAREEGNDLDNIT